MDTSLNAKKTYSKIGLIYMIIAVVFESIMYLINNYSATVTGYELDDKTLIMISFILRFLIFYPLMYILIRSIPKFDIQKKKMSIPALAACACVTYALLYVSNLLGMFLNNLAGKITGQGAITPIVDVISEMSPLIQIVVTVIVAPIYEELLFRKFLLDRIANYGEVTAMILSGLMFGLFHGNLSQCVFAATIGLFFAFVYLRTGKIQYTIALHVFVNGISTFMTTTLMKDVDLTEMMGYLNSGDMDSYIAFINENVSSMAVMAVFSLIIMMVVLAGIVFIVTLNKHFVFEHHDEEIEKGKRFRTAILNPGMLAYIIFFVAYIIWIQLGH